MKTYHFKKIIFFLILLGSSQVSWAACTQTLSPGANVASVVSTAANGSTICLNSGDYGNVNLNNMARTGYATLTSLNGTGAIMSPSVGNSNYIRFDRMSLTAMLINKSKNIQIVNSAFLPNKGGLAVVDSSNTLVDSVDFTNVNQATWSGRLSLNNASYSTITNSKFVGVGNSTNTSEAAADGIMIIGLANNNKIGPNNLFSGILQNLCDVANPGSHCDSIQFYGGGPNNVITGNYFVNGHTYIMAPDGSDYVTVTDNVFNGNATSSYDWKIQFGSANNVRFEHNTLTNSSAAFDSKPGEPASSNAVVRNNTVLSGSYKTSGGSGCSNCSFTRHLFASTSDSFGTNNLFGNPTFVGGTQPTSYAGYQLTSSSLGYQVATDGNDMGVVFTGITNPPPPSTTLAAPMNLRVN